MFKDKKFRVDERLIPQECHRATVDDVSWIDGKLCVCGTQIKDLPQVLEKINGSFPGVSMYFTRGNHTWLLVASGENAVNNLRRKMAPIRGFNDLLTMKHRWKPLVKTPGAKGAQPVPNAGIGALLDCLSTGAGLAGMVRTAAKQRSFMVMDLEAIPGWDADIDAVCSALDDHIAAGREYFGAQTGPEGLFGSARLFTAADLKTDDGDLICGGHVVTAAMEVLVCGEALGASEGDASRYWLLKAEDKLLLLFLRSAEEARIIPEGRIRTFPVSELPDFEGGLPLFELNLLLQECLTAEPAEVQSESAKAVEAHVLAMTAAWFDRVEKAAAAIREGLPKAF
ncbi:MAG: hypothetical protein SOX97_07270 [Sutterella sp.]|nr:hypothetical protein [Sutterella sp.]